MCATDIVAVSLESTGAAWVLFSLAGVLIHCALVLGRALGCPRCAAVLIRSLWKTIALFWKALSVPGTYRDPVFDDLVRLAPLLL